MSTIYTADTHQAMMLTSPQFVRRASAVHMHQVDDEDSFQVETNEGVMTGHRGDWLAFDTLSRHLWVVSDEYKQMHYIDLEEAQGGPTA